MGCKHRLRLPYSERIPPSKAVPRNPESFHPELHLEVLHCRGDSSVDDLLVVLREEVVYRPTRLVEVCGCGGAAEEIRGDGEVTSSGEGVGETRGVSEGELGRRGDLQFVFGELDAEDIGQIEDRRGGGLLRLRDVDGDCPVRYRSW